VVNAYSYSKSEIDNCVLQIIIFASSNMKKVKDIPFKQFVERFPKIDLPVTLIEESQRHFAESNKPLPNQMIVQFIEPIQGEPIDEYTEFQACFSIPKTKNFFALVYWKAGLMTYSYNLATFTKKGVLIDQQELSGTRVRNNIIARTVSTIDEEWNIFVVGGVESAENSEYDGTKSESIQFTLLDNGQIQPVVT